MRLAGMLEGQDYQVLQGDTTLNIRGLANDSRKVESGFVFIAIKGFEQDGHKYIGQSIDQGAIAIVLEDVSLSPITIPESVTVIQVDNPRKCMAAMATHFYNKPSKEFNLVGVTGTNGKTSTVFFINNVLESIGRKTGLIGTIMNKIGSKSFETERTTPDAIEVKSLFYQMTEENVHDVVMEVSSHALDLYRVAYSRFDVGVFTNLTLDHLDYHKTMDNYRNAKAKLFDMCRYGVINIDDEAGAYMMASGQCERYITFSTQDESAVLYAKDIVTTLTGVHFTVVFEGRSYEVSMQTPGRFTVYNGMAAMGACLALGIDMNEIVDVFKSNSKVVGRFQAIQSAEGYTAIIDYAHAPDGLENVLMLMEEIKQERIITVFGCGGDRDRSKRPKMGKIAGEHSDYTFITSDNPRTEVPEMIIKEIEAGMKETDAAYCCITDRKEAIREALKMAKKGDLVLIAGKGHEDYQIIGKTKHHFDDAEIVEMFMKEIDYVD